MMYFVLRHPGYQWRAALAAAICAGAATLVAGRPLPALRIPIALWGAALIALAAWVLRAPGDDGWVVVAAILFAVEGSLALTSTWTRSYGIRPRTPTDNL